MESVFNKTGKGGVSLIEIYREIYNWHKACGSDGVIKTAMKIRGISEERAKELLTEPYYIGYLDFVKEIPPPEKVKLPTACHVFVHQVMMLLEWAFAAKLEGVSNVAIGALGRDALSILRDAGIDEREEMKKCPLYEKFGPENWKKHYQK